MKLVADNKFVLVTPGKARLKLIINNIQFFDHCESCETEMHIDHLHWDADQRSILCEACLDRIEEERL